MRPKIFHMLHLAHRALFRAADRTVMARYGITAAQNSLLLYLLKNEGVRMSVAAEAIGLKNAALSGLVDRMERKGLLKREVSENDGRSYRLSTCQAGRDIAEQSQSLIRAANDDLMHGFSVEEQATITKFLEQVVDRADRYFPAEPNNG